MAKRRKTREQKKLADLRHNFNHSFVNKIHSEAKIKLETIKSPEISPKKQTEVILNEYPFLIKDLSKTGILTLLILGFQFVLFFLLKNQTLKIPGLIY